MRRYKALLILPLLLVSGCHLINRQLAPKEPEEVFIGEVTEISGAKIRYQPYHPESLKDYQLNGQTYRIVKKPAAFSQQGYANWFTAERNGQVTMTGDLVNSSELTAAHATLPLPSYVRVTNMNNGRQLVVLVNDRGPVPAGNIILLSEAVAFRLNMTPRSPIKIDVIAVAADGSLSGKGVFGSKVVEHSYALPERPDFSQSSGASLPSSDDSSEQVVPVEQSELEQSLSVQQSPFKRDRIQIDSSANIDTTLDTASDNHIAKAPDDNLQYADRNVQADYNGAPLFSDRNASNESQTKAIPVGLHYETESFEQINNIRLQDNISTWFEKAIKHANSHSL